MMTPEMVVPSTKRSSTYVGKFGAKAAETPNTACSARDNSKQNLRPYLREGDRQTDKQTAREGWKARRNKTTHGWEEERHRGT